MKKFNTLIMSTLVAGLLIGCGGGGSSSTTTSPTVLSGSFIDSPVEGLSYSTTTQSGTTDEYGTFTYLAGETVEFKIGNVTLGEAAGADMITPLTLAGDADTSNISTKASNIARLLQSLNSHTTDDKLLISSALNTLDINNIDIENEADINTILAAATNITGDTYVLTDSTDANSEMLKYINIYTNYSLLVPNKTYVNTGTLTAVLLLTNKARISATFNSLEGASASAWGINRAFANYSYKINDSSFNNLQTITSSSIDGITLEAGTYLIDLNFLEMGSTLTFTVDYIY